MLKIGEDCKGLHYVDKMGQTVSRIPKKEFYDKDVHLGNK